MGKGRTYELSLSNEISDNTTNSVHSTVSDYSGSADSSFCDVEVYHLFEKDGVKRVTAAFFEAKKRQGKSGNRVIIMSGSSGDESGLEELERLIDGTPIWGTAWVVINFTNRKPIVMEAHHLHELLTSDVETEEGPPTFDVRLTSSDSISMRKPTLDNWDSASSTADDWRVVLDAIGVDEKYIDPSEGELEA